jgi:hypothetical protein
MDANRDPRQPAGGPRTGEPRAPAARPKRASKLRLKILAGLAAGASFALPLAVMRAVPVPPRPAAVVLPKGAVVVVPRKGSAGVSTSPTHPAAHPVSVTRASGAPPP